MVTLPYRGNKIKLDLSAFPESFRLDLDLYVASLEHPDPLDELAFSTPLRSATVQQYRASLHRFASILVLAGIPIADVTTLSVLAAPEKAELGLRWMLAQKANKKTPAISEMSNLLRGFAKRFVRVDEATQRKLDTLDKLLAVKKYSGMTTKNRERLRPLEDSKTLRGLLLLPEKLIERAKVDGDLYRAALAREDAVAIAIFLNCPIRRKNLAGIHREQNLHRPGDGRVFLLFEPDEVKNVQRIEFELPKSVAMMIDSHLGGRSPQLCPAATQWLFPQRDGVKPMHLDHFSSRIRTRIYKELGLKVNVHLFRHIAAMIWLSANPGQYEALRRLLGHTVLSQTLSAYAGFEAGTATRLFAEVIEKAKL